MQNKKIQTKNYSFGIFTKQKRKEMHKKVNNVGQMPCVQKFVNTITLQLMPKQIFEHWVLITQTTFKERKALPYKKQIATTTINTNKGEKGISLQNSLIGMFSAT